MITIVSSGNALPTASDVFTGTSATGAPTAPAITTSTAGTFMYYILGNSATGNTASPGLTSVSSNTAGGVSLLGYGDVRATNAPAVLFTGSKTFNSIVYGIRILP
jgi:hypothetical protein